MRDFATELADLLHENESQRLMARVVEAATDGEVARHAAVVESGGVS